MRPLVIVNFVVYFIVLGLAAWSLDKYIEGEQDHPRGAIGECSVLHGFTHLRAWRTDSLATASSSAILSWAITAFSFGLACKDITMRGHRGKRLALASCSVLILHAGTFNSRFGPTYVSSSWAWLKNDRVARLLVDGIGWLVARLDCIWQLSCITL